MHIVAERWNSARESPPTQQHHKVIAISKNTTMAGTLQASRCGQITKGTITCVSSALIIVCRGVLFG